MYDYCKVCALKKTTETIQSTVPPLTFVKRYRHVQSPKLMAETNNNLIHASLLQTLVQYLAHFDKAISKPFFAIQLSRPLEFLLSFPGNFFGIAFNSMVLVPNITTWYITKLPSGHTSWKILVLIVFIVSTISWLGVFFGSIKARKFCYNRFISSWNPLVGIMILLQLDEPSESSYAWAKALGFFQMTSWCINMTLSIMLKFLSQRRRPIVYLCPLFTNTDSENIQRNSDLFSVGKKCTSALSALLRQDSYGSFPSGDAAGAVALLYPFLRYGTYQEQSLATILVGLSCFGRLYWLAHHFLDITVGVLISLFACLVLEKKYPFRQSQTFTTDSFDYGDCYACWWHPIASYLLMICALKFTKVLNRSKRKKSSNISIEEKRN